MNRNRTVRIAFIGPESSGKTTLCKLLSAHFKAPWVPEYARSYLTELDRAYTLEDVESIAKQQMQNEEISADSQHLLFCDTEPINFKVWCEHVFGACPDWINEIVSNKAYDHYILTYPDLDWEVDPLRENPGKGIFFFDWYRNILDTHQRSYTVVKGSHAERFETA